MNNFLEEYLKHNEYELLPLEMIKGPPVAYTRYKKAEKKNKIKLRK